MEVRPRSWDKESEDTSQVRGRVCVCVYVYVCLCVYAYVCAHTLDYTTLLPASSQLKFESVQDCLDYFNKHGLVELPNIPVDEDTYQLPRVDPIDPIVRYQSYYVRSEFECTTSTLLPHRHLACACMCLSENSVLCCIHVIISHVMLSLPCRRVRGMNYLLTLRPRK